MKLKNCERCSKDFMAQNTAPGRFCSYQCKYGWDHDRNVDRRLSQTEKRCSICKETKPVEGFQLVKKASQEWRQGRCRTCSISYTATWRKTRTKEQRAAKKISDNISVLKKRFGITREIYNEMMESQNGVCAICGGLDSSGRALSVDHDHDTDVVRGLLCHSCNVGIGLFKENINNLNMAIHYLTRDKN